MTFSVTDPYLVVHVPSAHPLWPTHAVRNPPRPPAVPPPVWRPPGSETSTEDISEFQTSTFSVPSHSTESDWQHDDYFSSEGGFTSHERQC